MNGEKWGPRLSSILEIGVFFGIIKAFAMTCRLISIEMAMTFGR